MDSYEKKYKNALEKAKSMIDDLRKGEDILAVSDLESMFPELKETEDERISREIIEFIMNFRNGNYEKPYDYTIGTWVGWLEMQGKKPNKIESFALFKAGDCITDGEHTWFISDVCFNMYILLPLDGIVKVEDTISHVDKHFRLWSINDAKDGDVLVYGDNPADHHLRIIMLFKSMRNFNSARNHFHIFDDEFRINDWCDCGKTAHPATKEQRES